MQKSETFRGDTGRNGFEAKSWATTMDLAINEMGWKAAVMKKFLEVAVRRILAFKVLYGANTDRRWDAVSDIEEKRRGCNTQKTILVNQASKA